MNKKSEKTKKALLPAEAGTLAGDDIYFFSSDYNLLYRVHIPELSVSVISHIPCEKVIAYRMFRKMRYWKDKLIMVPSWSEKIWIYDLSSREWKDVAIEHPQITLKFWGSVIYQDDIFLFGAAYPAILKVNLNDYSVTYLEINSGTKGLFCTDAVRIDHMVYSPVSISNQIMWMNLDTLEYGWKQIGSAGNEYCGIAYDGNDFWIPSWQHGKIVKWDGHIQWEEFELPEEIASRRYLFTGAVCDGDRIRFLPIQDGKGLEIRKDISGKDRVTLTEETKKYIHMEHYEDGTIVLMRSDASLEVKWRGTWIKGRCEIDYKDFQTYFCKKTLWDILSEKGITTETELFEMNDYINMITKEPITTNDFLSEKIVGIHIWNLIE